MLRRFIALTLVWAFVSISTVPLLPKQMLCAHASTALSDCDQQHHSQAVASKDLDMSDMMLEGEQITHVAKASTKAFKHKTLSAAEKKCRIECGCGCNRDVEGMPHLLAPHICSDTLSELSKLEIKPVFHLYQSRYDFVLRVPIPPPKSIS
ncbi:MAG: hypothetical protein Q9M28_11685 [Mariprofundaceae bacterium]|nr:hypothetical protein [Mariprofundaceae bacterium]